MPNVTVLISSFDGYSDCWGPVCHGFTKYWPDCPYPILLMTNRRDFPHPRIATLKVGGGTDWSERMVTALDRIPTRYVLYFQEDYWISAPVDTARITSYVDLMEQHGLNYLRLLAKPIPDADSPYDPRLGTLADDAPYRTSVQISFWQRDVFQALLNPPESVWQFEVHGTIRSRAYGATFVSVKRHGDDDYHHGIRYVCTAVNYGKWARMAKTYAAREGLAVDFTRLPSETWWDEFKRRGWVGAFFARWSHRSHVAFTDPVQALTKALSRLLDRPGRSREPVK
jgi:hypothetical protein